MPRIRELLLYPSKLFQDIPIQSVRTTKFALAESIKSLPLMMCNFLKVIFAAIENQVAAKLSTCCQLLDED